MKGRLVLNEWAVNSDQKRNVENNRMERYLLKLRWVKADMQALEANRNIGFRNDNHIFSPTFSTIRMKPAKNKYTQSQKWKKNTNSPIRMYKVHLSVYFLFLALRFTIKWIISINSLFPIELLSLAVCLSSLFIQFSRSDYVTIRLPLFHFQNATECRFIFTPKNH